MAFLRPQSKQNLMSTNDLDHQRLLAVINNMTEGVLATDSLGRINLSNSVALSLLNVNNLTGSLLNDALNLIDKSGRPVEMKKILSSSRNLVSTDWKLKYPDGSLVSLYLSISPIRVGYGQVAESGYVVIFRDITREKNIEEEREDFISVASHELRTPVAIVEGNVSNALLLAQQGDISETIKESLNAAHEQTVFLSNLINDLSMLSRAERGKLALTIEAFDVAEMVDHLAHDYESQAAAKKLVIEKKVESGVGILKSSQLYVREMLQNFIINAIKYTDKGKIVLTVNKKGDGVEFNISDTGIGISQSEQSRLFSKFFRSSDWRVRKLTGTGLGLYVSGKLARLLGGSVKITSQVNKGTTVSLFVPNLRQ